MPAPAGDRDRNLNRALRLATASVALGAVLLGTVLFFFFPRFSAGYLGRTSFNPALMTGFNDDVELGQIGEIKKNSTIVMRVKTGQPVAYPQLRWRGIALTHFDGRRWSEPERGAQTLSPNNEGWIFVGDGLPRNESHSPSLLYTIYLEPIASDAIFVPGKVVSLRGNFNGRNPATWPMHRGERICSATPLGRCSILFITTLRCATRDSRGFLLSIHRNCALRAPIIRRTSRRCTCNFRNSIRVSRRSRTNYGQSRDAF